MAFISTTHLPFLFLCLTLLLISMVSAEKQEDIQLLDLNYSPPQAPVTYLPPAPPVKPYTPPPVTPKPPTPPAKPYTPVPAPTTKPPIAPTKPYTPPPVTLPPPTPPVKTYPTPPKAPAPPSYTPPQKAPAPPTVTPPAPYRPPVKKEDCVPLCEGRCKLHSRTRVCVRACSTCCERCKCVPPGTYGNREVCGTCWTEMRTHGDRYKCP